METFLVESYEPPAVTQETGLVPGASIGADGSAGVRYVGSVRVPSDDTSFHLFAASSEAHLRDALEAAGIPFDRIVPADASNLIVEEQTRPDSDRTP